MEETKQLPENKPDIKELLRKENQRINNMEFFGGDVFNSKEVKAYLSGAHQYRDGYKYFYNEDGSLKEKQINWKQVTRSQNQVL